MQNMPAPNQDELSHVRVEAPSAPLLGYSGGIRHVGSREDLRHRPTPAIFMLMTVLLGLGLFLVVIRSSTRGSEDRGLLGEARGVSEGVSAKSGPIYGPAYPWTAKLLAWQRTAYHFQPKKNWMNGGIYFTTFYSK